MDVNIREKYYVEVSVNKGFYGCLNYPKCKYVQEVVQNNR